MKLITTISAMAVIASIAGAQSFNLDFEVSSGVGAGAPSNGFAAAGNAGVWSLIGLGPTGSLVDVSGSGTGVSVTVAAGGTFTSNIQGYPAGDDTFFMTDIADGPSLVTFAGLMDGAYNVWVYAQAPDSAAFTTAVTIGGNMQTVGGAWGGSYVLGNTHSFHGGVNVVGGVLSITMAPNDPAIDLASLNGIQLEVVPEPATIVGLALGAFSLLVLRRKR